MLRQRSSPATAVSIRPLRHGGILSRLVISAGLLVACGAGVYVFADQLGLNSGSKTIYVTAEAKQGPLEVTTTERGSIDSAANVTLVNRVEGSTTIIRIIPEGSKAQKGDVLVELDSAALRDKETQQRIDLEQAEATLKQAIEAKAIQLTQNDSDINAAELKLLLAKLDLEQYEQGDYLKESSDLKGKRVLAQEELKRAQESYDFSKRNSNKGYVSQSALESARIAVTQKQLALSVADEAVRVLETYIYERQIAEKRANATEFVRELDRVKRKAAAALSQAEADESASRLRAEVERSKLDKLREQIALCTIIAPQDGEVVYANGSSSDRRGGGSSDQPLIQEGSQVRERQAIINLPDYTKMQVNARVHESRIGSIRQNLRAVVRTEATGAMLFNGIIETVSSVPLSGNWPNRDLKEYATTIRLTDPVDVLRQLKPGLSAEVEVKVDFIPNCINVPVQSIITVGPKQYAFPVINGTPQVREVVIGKTNDIVIEIKDGLKAGDRVLMNPRSILSKEIAKLEDAAREDEEKRQEEDAKNNPGRTEMAPVVPPVSPGQPGGPGNAVAGAPPAGAGGRAPGSFDPGMIFTRLDTNSDGKITADEATEDRTKDMVATMDTNGDSALDLDELKAGFAKRRASGGGGPGGGGPRQGGGAP